MTLPWASGRCARSGMRPTGEHVRALPRARRLARRLVDGAVTIDHAARRARAAHGRAARRYARRRRSRWCRRRRRCTRARRCSSRSSRRCRSTRSSARWRDRRPGGAGAALKSAMDVKEIFVRAPWGEVARAKMDGPLGVYRATLHVPRLAGARRRRARGRGLRHRGQRQPPPAGGDGGAVVGDGATPGGMLLLIAIVRRRCSRAATAAWQRGRGVASDRRRWRSASPAATVALAATALPTGRLRHLALPVVHDPSVPPRRRAPAIAEAPSASATVRRGCPAGSAPSCRCTDGVALHRHLRRRPLPLRSRARRRARARSPRSTGASASSTRSSSMDGHIVAATHRGAVVLAHRRRARSACSPPARRSRRSPSSADELVPAPRTACGAAATTSPSASAAPTARPCASPPSPPPATASVDRHARRRLRSVRAPAPRAKPRAGTRWSSARRRRHEQRRHRAGPARRRRGRRHRRRRPRLRRRSTASRAALRRPPRQRHQPRRPRRARRHRLRRLRRRRPRRARRHATSRRPSARARRISAVAAARRAVLRQRGGRLALRQSRRRRVQDLLDQRVVVGARHRRRLREVVLARQRRLGLASMTTTSPAGDSRTSTRPSPLIFSTR